MFRTIRPHPALATWVDAFWASAPERLSTNRILPDTCADIIFNAGQHTFNACPEKMRIAPGNAFVAGTMTRFQDLVHRPQCIMIGIRFLPGGLNAFTRLPLQEITDDMVLLRDVTTKWEAKLAPVLSSGKSMEEKIQYIEHFLLQHLPSANVIHQRINATITHIRSTAGTAPIDDLAAMACMSRRHYERCFLQHTGVSPKMFSRTVRFLAVRQQLKQGRHQTLLELALDNGFYDHSHLTREFTAFAGYTPQSLVIS
ncbi:AraC family transcriptional regulator [Chitinophaga vietnamensis]|uniref:AraC family transcriptional regulator n=1 Tax=Chitinophaga vietnamensis TaxID=2593957 RepID=UPI001177DA1E|nr:helix-turn-helix domain-containing protein [Chitinophaga vietnamensis]